MDQQTPQAPEIKTEVNKREERKSGFFVTLLSKLTGGAAATGGVGAGGAGLGGAAVSGGLLATKAGVVALVLAGSTVAGGLGLVGYKVFGPNASSQKGAEGREGFNSAFEVRPQEAAPADIEAKAEADAKAAAAARAEGTSSSLQFLAQANQNLSGTPPVEEKKPEAEAAPVSDAAASAGIAPLVNNNAPAAGTSAKTLSAKKIGQLSSGSSGGSSGGATAAAAGSGAGSATGAMPHTAIAGARLGNSSGMGAGLAGRTAMGKGIARAGGRPRGPGSSMAFARSALRANTGRVLGSAPAGVTYDGGSAASSMAGPDSARADGGVNPGGGDPKLKDKPASATPGSTPHEAPGENIPNVAGADVTPWKKTIEKARMMLIASLALMALAYSLVKSATTAAAVTPPTTASTSTAMWNLRLAQVLLALSVTAGLGAMVLGTQLMHGKYNQKAQGMLLALSGGLAAAAAGTVMVSVHAAQPVAKFANLAAIIADNSVGTPAAVQTRVNAVKAQSLLLKSHGKVLAASAGKIAPIAGGVFATLAVCGGLAVVGMVGSLLNKPRKVSAKDCGNNCHGNSYHYRIPSPSENILTQYLS